MGNAERVRIESLLEKQFRAECEFLADFKANEYTFENPKIVYNPYLINPCAALILFRTPEPVKVTITVRGKTPGTDISHTYGRKTEHILPILGLYDAYENTVEIRLYQGESRQIKIQTSGNPRTLDVLTMNAKPEHLKDHLVIIVPALTGFPTGIDANGDIRWYLSENMMFAGKKLANGHFMIGTERKILSPYYATGVYEMDMIGKIYKEYRVPGLYHHDHAEMENGNLIILSDDFSPGSDTIEDTCVIINRSDGEVIKNIAFKDFLPRGTAMSGCGTLRDWFHNNALAYDEENHSLILSGRHMDALVSYNMESEEINWIIGDPETWPEDMLPLFFTPVGEGDFDWQYEQHAAVLTPDGDVMCFDNGHWRAKKKENYRPNKNNFSRGVRYRLNTKNRTIEQIWQYGKERGTEFFSQFISNVEYLGEENYLIHSGGIQKINGISIEGVLPPDKWNQADVISDTVEVYGEEVLWEMTIKNNYFRASKLPLYEEGDNLTLGKGVQLGHLFSSPCDREKKFNVTEMLVPEDMLLYIIEETDYFLVKGRFDDNVEAYLYLVNVDDPDETRAYKINTVPNKYDAVSCLPYIPENPRNKSMVVTKEGFSGMYRIYMVLENNCCQTGITLNIE